MGRWKDHTTEAGAFHPRKKCYSSMWRAQKPNSVFLCLKLMLDLSSWKLLTSLPLSKQNFSGRINFLLFLKHINKNPITFWFQVATGRFHFAVITFEKELYTWAVSCMMFMRHNNLVNWISCKREAGSQLTQNYTYLSVKHKLIVLRLTYQSRDYVVSSV